MNEPWMTKREIAQELRVSPRTVTRLKLPHTRVGGQNRYRMTEVEAALAKDPKSKPPFEPIPVAPDAIEILLTLSPTQYDQMGRHIRAIREGRNSSSGIASVVPTHPSNTEIILGAVRALAQTTG